MAPIIFIMDSAGLQVYISNPAHWLPLEGEEVALRMIFNKLFILVRFNCIKEK